MPIHHIDFIKSTGQKLYDQIISLVERMLDLNKQLGKTKTPQTKSVIQRQIETTDKQIDELVYELYGLAEDEIKIVESAAV
jgi:hypothetical protein